MEDTESDKLMEDSVSENSESSISSTVETVKTIGDQVKDTVVKVLDLRQGKSSNRNDECNDGTSLLSPNKPRGTPSYGSFPSTSFYNPKTDLLTHEDSQERKLSMGNPLNKDNYIRNFAETLPAITVDKITSTEKSLYESTDRERFASFVNPQPNLNYLSVNTSPKHGGGESSSRRSSVSDLHSPLPTGSAWSGSSEDHEPEKFTWQRYTKIFIVVVVFLGAAVIITLTSENIFRFIQVSASKDHPLVIPLQPFLPLSTLLPLLTMSLTGRFATEDYTNTTKDSLFVKAYKKNSTTGEEELISEPWQVPISDMYGLSDLTLTHTFSLKNLSELFELSDDTFFLEFQSTTELSFPMILTFKMLPNFIDNGAMFGGFVMIGLYVLIIFELINRTLSAMLAATVAIGILSAFRERPTMEELVSWLDMETLILLFSMMVMVSILCETGFFNYCSFLMYKITNGAVWPMITALCFFTAIVSAFLDNVTTILLMTPVTIRICEAMQLNPVPILISIVVFSNIGGAATPVGDPPNVIIANDPDVVKAGIDFTAFVTHMALGIIPVMLVAYLQLRVMFRSMKSLQFEEPYLIAELKREIDVWSRAVASLSSYSKDESHVKTILESKILHLKSELKSKKRMGGQSVENYKATLAELEESCRIKDWPLLIKCGIVLSMVIILFFIHSIPQLKLSMGWTALLGAVLLLTLADRRELEGILTRVEWSTLIFFSALFIVMEGVSKLGLLDYIGSQTEAVILNVNPDSRTIVAILIILWVSGIASAFIDNIPFTTMMIKIVTRVSASLNLPLQPLVWALAFGTCLGGNGTLIGASANVVCAGVADQHGYRFTFIEYFRIGFPMMIVSLVIASAYLSAAYYLGFY